MDRAVALHPCSNICTDFCSALNARSGPEKYYPTHNLRVPARRFLLIAPRLFILPAPCGAVGCIYYRTIAMAIPNLEYIALHGALRTLPPASRPIPSATAPSRSLGCYPTRGGQGRTRGRQGLKKGGGGRGREATRHLHA